MDQGRTIELADGRTLGYAEWGDPDGTPVLSLHGTPGCRLNRPPDESKVAAAGLRLVTYDRPGYGNSSRHAGRRIVDCVADVQSLLDALRIDRFAVSGGSGGGPHCLALAAGLGARVNRALCIVGVAPYDVLGDRFFDGMDPENVKEFGWALAGESTLHDELTTEATAMQARFAQDPTTILGDFDLPEADREILARTDVQTVMQQSIRGAFNDGVWGWADDDLAFTTPWGFDVADITVPTAIWWGAHDVLTPPGHGEWLAAHVPDAVTFVDHSGGHQADPDKHLSRLTDWLLRGIPRTE